jgi:hypothetical protein
MGELRRVCIVANECILDDHLRANSTLLARRQRQMAAKRKLAEMELAVARESAELGALSKDGIS